MTSSSLTQLLDRHVRAGRLPGAVAAVASGPDLEVAVVGARDVDGPPMTRDTIFRIASNSKPITAAATMLLVDEGRLGLDDPVERWLPELASPMVVRTPQAPVDDVVPARWAIAVRDLLTFRSGHGLAADFSLPAVVKLMDELRQGPPAPRDVVAPDDWMRILATVPLLHHPGDAWLYNTGSDILGVLVARVAGRPFAEFLAERIFAPLGMRDTGFQVPGSDLDRFTTAYRPDGAELAVTDPPDGQWSTPPAFASGSGGLVSTLDDLLAFQQMLLAGGAGVLSPEAVALTPPRSGLSLGGCAARCTRPSTRRSGSRSAGSCRRSSSRTSTNGTRRGSSPASSTPPRGRRASSPWTRPRSSAAVVCPTSASTP